MTHQPEIPQLPSADLNSIPTLTDSPQGVNFSEEEPTKGFPKYLVGGIVLSVTLVTAIVYFTFFRGGDVSRPDLLLHTVKRENIDLTIVTTGTLESAMNQDVICRVKAGSRGNFASTIKWVIDDGTNAQKGQTIMTLDSSQLEDMLRTQRITLEKAKAAKIAAEQNLQIVINQNESDIATAGIAIQLAELNLEKYVGLPRGTLNMMTKEDARATLVEMDTDLEGFFTKHPEYASISGEYQQLLDDVSGRIELAESDVELLKDRLAYSQRMQLKGFLSPSQVLAEESRLSSARETLKKIRSEEELLKKFNAQISVKDLSAKVLEAWRAYDRTVSQSEAKRVQADADSKTATSVFIQETDKLLEIEDQLARCTIVAPVDGMVIYYTPETSRWSSSERGLIQQGATVSEGQKLFRFPDLKKMQVTTRIHEAMISKIRADEKQSTGVVNSIRAGNLLSLNPLASLISQEEDLLNRLRDDFQSYEYEVTSQGQAAKIRIDAFPNKVFNGHVKSVASVASAADYFSSDVKVYNAVIAIDDEVAGLRPGMSAEVTIEIANTVENVVSVPVQAVVGGAGKGKTRKVYVMTPTGAMEREVVLGVSNERYAEVKSGLDEGEQVVINPKAIVGDSELTRDDPQAGGAAAAKKKGPPKGGQNPKAKQ
ncbi:MAG: hypothetical protein R3B84_13290 [Zavarzinella sp.]